MKLFKIRSLFPVVIAMFLSTVAFSQSFTILQNVTGNNRSDIRGQKFTPSEQGSGDGEITSSGPVYLTSFEVIYAGGTEAPTLYIYSQLPADLASLDDGTGGTLVAESTGKTDGEFPYTAYSFDYVELDKNTAYYAVFRQDVQLEFGGSGSESGPYPGGKMLVNSGALVAENNFTALKFIGRLNNTQPPHQGDVDALTALYNATDGANWTNTWDIGGDPYEWHGVTWNGNRVTSIILNNNGLNGNIPADLGSLSHLEELNLRRNSLEGSLPVEIGDLTNLRILELSANSLRGTIPEELSSLTNLEHLYIGLNSVEGNIPPELFDLIKLESLSLSFNSLSGPIPAEIGNLINLRILDLSHNSLTGSIPDEIANLTELTNLTLSYNPLNDALPATIGNLTELIVLNCYECSLSGSIPGEIGNLINLNSLFLSYNSLSGTLPVEIGNLSKLENLHLSGNLLEGAVPGEIMGLDSIQDFRIDNNHFDHLPDLSASSLPEEILTINGNKFTFEDIEPNLSLIKGNWSQEWLAQQPFSADTTYYVKAGANLTIEQEVGGQNNLYQWRKNGEDIEGAENSELLISNFSPTDTGSYQLIVTNSLVTALTLESGLISIKPDESQIHAGDSLALVALFNNTNGENWNQKAGWLEAPVKNWYGVTHFADRVVGLSLSENNLTGVIPEDFGELTELLTLDLNDNSLTGNTAALTNLSKLHSLDISNNLFDDLSDFSASALTELKVSNNRFTFEDLEPNIGVITENTGQKPFGEEQTYDISKGANQTLSFLVGGEHNVYHWVKDGVNLENANAASFEIEKASHLDLGEYTLQVTNTLVTGVTLESQPVIVTSSTIITGIEGEVPAGSVLIYPNPMQNETTVYSPGAWSQNADIQIFDLRGSFVPHHVVWKSPDEFNLIFDSQATGVFFVKIKNGEKVEMRKLIRSTH